jgi:hypothetical protein
MEEYLKNNKKKIDNRTNYHQLKLKLEAEIMDEETGDRESGRYARAYRRGGSRGARGGRVLRGGRDRQDGNDGQKFVAKLSKFDNDNFETLVKDSDGILVTQFILEEFNSRIAETAKFLGIEQLLLH